MSAPIIFIIIVATVLSVTLGSDPPVNCTVTRAGGRADLTCRISSLLDVVQVTWQRRTGDSYQTLVTRSRRFGVKISKSYENRVSAPRTKNLGTSTIALSELEIDDVSCFRIIYNLFPEGTLEGDVCLPKPDGVREVVCRSPSGFKVILDPPQIKTQHSETHGVITEKGRWLNHSFSPMCTFYLQGETKSKRSVPEKDKEFSTECEASGEQKPTITWTDEGRPIRIEEKENITGDVITVTSTRHHVWSTFPKDKEIRCHISYNQSPGGLQHEPDQRLIRVLCVVPPLLLLGAISVIIYWRRSSEDRPGRQSPEDRPGRQSPEDLRASAASLNGNVGRRGYVQQILPEKSAQRETSRSHSQPLGNSPRAEAPSGDSQRKKPDSRKGQGGSAVARRSGPVVAGTSTIRRKPRSQKR
ncbi:OX-2 membrane glycoprotein-like isoform X2 [Engystomops pustulosus]|uniref:OX-2 membrane glycoprotein-like isoform X2 n=1 Tax=Engystomops pustulosus TaxID=76066 RepID=UPI003AFB08F9